MGVARIAGSGSEEMGTTASVRRGEAVLALLRRLRRRPLVPRPGTSESPEELYSRVDSPGHAAQLGEEQYTTVLRSARVAWKSVLAFITQEPDGSLTRAFWIDPLRLTCFGCLLDEEDIAALAPLFGLDHASTRPLPAEIDVARIVRRVDAFEVGGRFLLPDGRVGEVAERYAADMGMVSVCLDPDSVSPSWLLLGPETPVYPAEEEPTRTPARAARKRGKLRLMPPDG
jgi:hypothetical protein